MADVQIAVIDQQNTQIALAAPSETQVNAAVPGVQGPAGEGVPQGGTANQVLFKQSGTDYDTAWGEVTSAMIGDLEIVNADVAANAEIAVSKLADGAARQLLQTDAAGTGVEWTNNVDVPGTLDVTSTATFDSIARHPLGTAGAPTITFTGDNNTGIYSPGADQVALSTNGTGRLFINSTGTITTDTAITSAQFNIVNPNTVSTYDRLLLIRNGSLSTAVFGIGLDSFYIASAPASPMVFCTNSDGGVTGSSVPTNERMRITSAGLVGIGTSTPSKKLEIANGDVRLSDGYTISWGDDAWRIFRNGAQLRFDANGTQALTIDSSQRVGIGDSAPGTFDVRGAKLTLADSTSDGIGIKGRKDSLDRWYVGYNSSDHLEINQIRNNVLAFKTNNAEVARLTNSGQLLVGTSSARSNFFNTSSVAPGFQLEGTASEGRIVSIVSSNSSGSDTASLILAHQKSGAVGGNTILASGDIAGRLSFQGSDGSEFVEAAYIQAEIDGTPGANDMPGRLVFSTTADGSASPTERLRIDSSGRVGIGTTSPQDNLQVGYDTTAHISIANTGSADVTSGIQWRFGSGGATYSKILSASSAAYASYLSFYTSSSEKARLDSSGRLLVGTSSSRSPAIWNNPRFQVESTAYASSAISIINNQSTNAEPSLILGKSGGPTLGSNTIVQANDTIGTVSFQGADGSSLLRGAEISCAVDGTPGANDMPGRLVFSTTADGASSPTERVRIDSSGRTGFGVAPNTYGDDARITIQGTGVTRSIFSNINGTGSGTHITFGNGNGAVGSITTSGSATAYNTSSDYRLKENVTPVTDGITRLQQLKPSRFNFIADPDKTVDGFLAHEVQTVVPEAITGEKDAVDDDGNPIYQGIDQSKLVPLLTAALQEAVAKIESLEARLTAAGI